ncbi:F-box/LRR-repeat protein 4, partial [Linum grandiflorum]
GKTSQKYIPFPFLRLPFVCRNATFHSSAALSGDPIVISLLLSTFSDRFLNCLSPSTARIMRGHNWINTLLPDEIILEIFSRLASKQARDACSVVCKRWLSLERLSRTTLRIGASGNPDLFIHLLSTRFPNIKTIHIDERLSISLPVQLGRKRRKSINESSFKLRSMFQEDLPDSEQFHSFCLSDAGLITLSDQFPALQHLSLIWCSNVSSLGLLSLAQKCSLLKSLDLQGCYVGDGGLSAVGKCCKQLEELNLRFCEGLSDVGLIELAEGCGISLKTLGVAACAKITDKSLEAVGSHCKSLETLSLDSEFIQNDGVLAIAKGCPHLNVLKLQCINVTDEALIAVGKYSSSLEVLALYSFQRFTDRGLFAIGDGCKKLKNLTLSDCYFLSDQGLGSIAKGCKELTHLEVNGCHNIGTIGLEAIGRSCTRLTELALLYCQRIGDNALDAIGKGCKYLEALHLVDCSSIGDDAICSIANGCTNLKKLHIRRCYEVGNKGIIAVGEKCKSLEDLSLRFCDRVGDDALVSIGQCHSLKTLNVSGCHQIGDTGITAIARGCPELSYLDVSVLQNLGDMALAEVGEGCPALKEIVISHCRQITDVGLSHLARNCSMLESCHAVYCPGVTAAGVATVVSGCRNIKKVLVEKWKVSERTKRRAASVISYLCIDL